MTATARPNPKKAARDDVLAGRWNPNQFTIAADRDQYGRSWDYFYTMSGNKGRNYHARA